MIQILQYRGVSMISKAIQFQTRSPYSHTAVQLGEHEIYEAWHVGGVRKLRYATEGHSDGTAIDIFRLHPSVVCDVDKARRFAQSQLGKKYDFKSVARFLSRRKVSLDDKWFCSEYGLEILMAGGLQLLNLPSSLASPRDVSITPLMFYHSTIGGK